MANKLGAAAKAVLSKGEAPEKVRTSFYISKAVKEKFFKMCEQRGIVPSEMVEALMKDAMESI